MEGGRNVDRVSIVKRYQSDLYHSNVGGGVGSARRICNPQSVFYRTYVLFSLGRSILFEVCYITSLVACLGFA
jgi:hypothetical protein